MPWADQKSRWSHHRGAPIAGSSQAVQASYNLRQTRALVPAGTIVSWDWKLRWPVAIGALWLAGGRHNPPLMGMGFGVGMGWANSSPNPGFGTCSPAPSWGAPIACSLTQAIGLAPGLVNWRKPAESERIPGLVARGLPRPSCPAMSAPPVPPGAESPLPRWMRLVGAGLTALVAVLALVLFQEARQQASRSQALERRVQDLENRRDLERTQALETQLSAQAQRLQGLEASAGQVQELEQQQQELRRQLQSQLQRATPLPPELLPFSDPSPAPALGPSGKPAAKPALKSPANSQRKSAVPPRP